MTDNIKTTVKAEPVKVPSDAISVVGMPEFDALMDHIYENGTASEGVLPLANAFARAILAREAVRLNAQANPSMDSIVHAAVIRALDEASVRNDVLREMCIEAALEKARDMLEETLEDYSGRDDMQLDAVKSTAAIAWGWLWHVHTADDRVKTARHLLGEMLDKDLKRYGIQTAKAEGAQVNAQEIEATMLRGEFGDPLER